jgi:hypothetical protein
MPILRNLFWVNIDVIQIPFDALPRGSLAFVSFAPARHLGRAV